MLSALDLVKKAEELKKQGSPAGLPSQPAKSQRLSVPAGREDTFERLLRMTLYQQNQIDNLQTGATLVFILHEPKVKAALVDAMKLWDDSRPTVSQEDRLKGVFHEHPLGDRKVFLTVSLLQCVLEITGMKGSALGELFATMAAMETDQLQTFIGTFAPRFPTPRDGRPWVWEMVLGGLATDEFRKLLVSLIAASAQQQEKIVRVEMARKGQTELKKALWDDLRDIQSSRGR